MNKKSKYDVFLSYAVQDSAIVRQIYDDLRRANIKVWEFRHDGERGVDFVSEYKEKIENAEYFCLIDSPWARKAEHVKSECEFAIERESVRGYPKILPCRICPSGSWDKGSEVFYRQNRRVWIDFSNYRVAIKELCAQLGGEFVYQPEKARDEDFLEEMRSLKLFTNNRDEIITVGEWQSLKENYEQYTLSRDNAKVGNRKNQIKLGILFLQKILIICESNKNIKLISPYLELGILLGELGKEKAARKTFRKAADSFPDDPRPYMGIGGTYYFQKKHVKAISNYIICSEKALASKNEKHIAALPDIEHNICQVLIEKGSINEALKKIKVHVFDTSSSAELLGVFGKALLMSGNFLQATSYLERSIEFLKMGRMFLTLKKEYFLAVLFDLAECYGQLGLYNEQFDYLTLIEQEYFPDEPEVYREIAKFYWYYGDMVSNGDKNEMAIRFYEKAIEFRPNAVKYYAELASIYYELNDHALLNKYTSYCFELEKKYQIRTDIDHYYLGLAYYLLDKNSAVAEREYELSQRNTIVKNWTHYKNLVS
ncbi:MAG: TIR domain-containing protein [Saprospiraceae bacterium]|nr:TIR domain-containing protein [Saprospiraceae bacterium]